MTAPQRYDLELLCHGMDTDHEMRARPEGDWVRWTDYEALEESHAWKISPAMAQARIDQLNAQVQRLERELADERMAHESCHAALLGLQQATPN